MKLLILYFCFFTLLFTESIILKNSFTSMTFLDQSATYTDKDNLLIESFLKRKNIHWEKVGKNLHSFGFADETIWVKVAVKNETDQTDFYLTSEYAWIDEVNFYLLREGKILVEEKNGDRIAFNNRTIKFKLPAFELKLEPFQNFEIYISFRSKSEKLVDISLEDKNTFLNRSNIKRDFFIPYLLVSIIVLFLNSIIILRTKSILSFYYSVMVLALLIYLSILNGAFYEYLFPNSTFESDRLLYAFGFIFIYFYSQAE